MALTPSPAFLSTSVLGNVSLLLSFSWYSSYRLNLSWFIHCPGALEVDTIEIRVFGTVVQVLIPA